MRELIKLLPRFALRLVLAASLIGIALDTGLLHHG